MSGPQQPNVFISYARKDGLGLAQRLQADLSSKGLDVWLDTQRISGGACWTKEIEQALDACQVALALLTPGSYVSDICRAEQLRALRKGKMVIPLLAQASSDIPLHLEAKNYRDFTGAKPYADQFKFLLEDISLGRNAVPLRPEFRTTYVTAPPLPRNYVERPEALANLRNFLIRDGLGPSIALTAFEGMGGIGKTILAQALCHDAVVQQAFPDGIVWITAGKESYSLVDRMREAGKVLRDDLTAYDTELGCINRYRTVMREKAALIVLDDVWHSVDVEPFRANSPRSRLLFTTRDASIAAAVGAEELIADLLTPSQSRELLARWCGRMREDLPSEAEEVIEECGRLPLALGMIGAMLRGKPHPFWKHVVSLLRHADLERVKAQFPDYPHTDLLRAIQVSVDALDPTTRDRYLALAILLEDMLIHPIIYQTLWGANELAALDTAMSLVSLSLAQRDADSDTIRLHDLQLDYVRSQYADKETLELIQGAVRLSSNVIDRDPRQFVSQMVGRLLPHWEIRAVQQFGNSVIRAAPRPWLRPLRPALDPTGSALARTLAGHSDRVNAVAVNADGRRAVSASADKTLKVWDLRSGRELRTLVGHTSTVSGVAVSADGRLAVSGSGDKTLKVWDLETGRELFALPGHSGSVWGVAVSEDGHQAVSASDDKTLKVWDLTARRELRSLNHPDPVLCVSLSADGRRALSVTQSPSRPPDLGVGYRGEEDMQAQVWDLETGSVVGRAFSYGGVACAGAVSANGRWAICPEEDWTLTLWEVDTGHIERRFGNDGSEVLAVATSSDGRRAVCASRDGTLKVWDLEMRNRAVLDLVGHRKKVLSLAVSADGRRAVSGSFPLEFRHNWSVEPALKVWDLEPCRESGPLYESDGPVVRVAVSRDALRALSLCNGRITVWNLETRSKLHELTGHSGWVSDVSVSADWRWAVSASADRTLRIWDLESGRELRTLGLDSDGPYGVAVSRDGHLAVSASGDKTLKVWDLETGRQMHTLAGHSERINRVQISLNAKWAVSASSDKTLKVWNLETGRELRTLAVHSDVVNDVALSAERDLAVSASQDKTVSVWNLATGVVLATFTCDAAVMCCAWKGNQIIVAGDELGRVHFLSLELKEHG